MRCNRRLRNYQLETWGATSRHGSGYGLEGQAHFKQIHFNNAKYKQWQLIHPITVWTHILQPSKYQRDVVAYWVNNLSDVAFVAGMLKMNWRSATTCYISNRWLAEWPTVLFSRERYSLLHLKSHHRNQRPTSAVGRECVHDATSKTQMCAFHLRNRESKRELNVVWNGRPTRLSNTTTPVYLGVNLDRTTCYKTHIEKTKMKVNARNNIIRKLASSKWGCKASTLRSSCLALCYSSAEYTCPVWIISTHARKLNPALHVCCRIISGCLKPTNLDSVQLLAGIAPPHTNCSITDPLLPDWIRGSYSHAARLVCEQQQTAAHERQSDRRASLHQNVTAGGRVFAGWIWRGLVLLARC